MKTDHLVQTLHPNEPVELCYKLPVLHHEWEGDGWGWVYSAGDKRVLVLSNHGSCYVADPEELNELLAYYKDIISQTEEALKKLISSRST